MVRFWLIRTGLSFIHAPPLDPAEVVFVCVCMYVRMCVCVFLLSYQVRTEKHECVCRCFCFHESREEIMIQVISQFESLSRNDKKRIWFFASDRCTAPAIKTSCFSWDALAHGKVSGFWPIKRDILFLGRPIARRFFHSLLSARSTNVIHYTTYLFL